MRKLFTIFFFIPFLVQAQSETHNFTQYDTVIAAGGHNWHCRVWRPLNYFTPNNPDTASRPLFVAMPGQGQQGTTDTAAFSEYGPSYLMNHGWHGGVTITNGTHYPLIVTIVDESSVTPNPSIAYPLLIILKNLLHPKFMVGTGFSQGSFTLSGVIEYEATLGDHLGMQVFKALCMFEGTPTSPANEFPNRPQNCTGSWCDTNYYKTWAKVYGGTYFYLEGSGSDNFRDGWHYSAAMNDTVANSAYFSYQDATDNRPNGTAAAGSHCCWNAMWDTTAMNWTSVGTLGPLNSPSQAGTNTMGNYKNGNVWMWMLRQGDTSLVGGGSTSCRAFTWDSTQINVLITDANMGASPRLHRCDTVYIPKCTDAGGYRTFSTQSVGVQTDSNSGRIHIKGKNTTNIKIKPSSSPIQGNIWGNNNWIEVDSIVMLNSKDPVIFNPYFGGYSHHVFFHGGNTTQSFFPSGDITQALPNFAADTVNCMFDWHWDNWHFDMGIGDTATPAGGGPFGGLTYIWLGALAKNGVVIGAEIDHSIFLNNASDSAPATDIHMENCYYCYIHDDTLQNMGVVAKPVGHASVAFAKVSMVVVKSNLFRNNFGNTLTSRGLGDIPSMYPFFRYWANLKGDTSYDGRSSYVNNRDSGSRKYPALESENDPTDTTYNSFYRSRVSPYCTNNTCFRMNLGAGHSYYYNSMFDGYGGATDSVYFHNNSWTSIVSDTAVSCPFSTSQGGCVMMSFPNGLSLHIDSANNSQTYTSLTSGLDSVTLRPLNPGPVYQHGVAAKPFPAKDFYGLGRPISGTVDIGSAQFQGILPKNYIPVPVGWRPVIH